MIGKDGQCFFCENTLNLEDHHCLHGWANRKKAEKYGLKVWLCNYHHTGSDIAVHNCKSQDRLLQEYAQRYFEENIGDRELWMKEFGKNYL
jgi:hypothetical protein